MRTSTRADANAVVAYAIHRTVTSCFICFTHIIPFRAAHLPRYLPTRRDAASPWFICLASHPKATHRPGASRRRGETPHLLGPSAWHRTPRRRTVPVRHADAARRRISLGRHLLQYVTGRAKASIMMKLRRFTKRLRYRCGLCFANFNHPLPTWEGRACRGRHEDAEGAQRAQCPNSSAPGLARMSDASSIPRES